MGKIGGEGTLTYAVAPKFDPALIQEDTITIAVQVNGKLRATIAASPTATKDELEAAAKAVDKIQPFLEGKTMRRVVVVPKRLVNFVVTG